MRRPRRRTGKSRQRSTITNCCNTLRKCRRNTWKSGTSGQAATICDAWHQPRDSAHVTGGFPRLGLAKTVESVLSGCSGTIRMYCPSTPQIFTMCRLADIPLLIYGSVRICIICEFEIIASPVLSCDKFLTFAA